MAKLSVVIPVYNVESYLWECLDSVVNQTLTDIEIILVDDGSTDGSTEICRSYVERDARIKFLRQENTGVSAARKNGAMLASGQYVGFVDADDYISLDLYEKLLERIGNCDLAVSGWFGDADSRVKRFEYMPQGIYETPEQMKYLIDNMIRFGKTNHQGLWFIWNKLYRRELVELVFKRIGTNLFFGEDSDFLYRYILQCKAVCITDVCGYYYRWRDHSAWRTVRRDYLININELYLSLYEVFQAHPYAESLMEQLQHWMLWLMLNAPRIMGFSAKSRVAEYISPFLNTMTDKRVALYGAGLVGQDYYLQMQKVKGCKPVIWVDKRWDYYQGQFPVSPVERLLDIETDYVILAVKSEALAQSIRQELLALGLEGRKLLWKEPISSLL